MILAQIVLSYIDEIISVDVTVHLVIEKNSLQAYYLAFIQAFYLLRIRTFSVGISIPSAIKETVQTLAPPSRLAYPSMWLSAGPHPTLAETRHSIYDWVS